MNDARRKLREEVMELLYQYDFYESKFELKNELFSPESIDLFNQVIKELEQVDLLIEKNLFDYSLNRLNKVDKAIIRLATYELLKKELAHTIVINEAIELTKEFSNLDDAKQHRFTNKVLDQIYQSIK